MIKWMGNVPIVKVEDTEAGSKEHKKNCEEFAFLACYMIGGMTKEDWVKGYEPVDGLLKKAFNLAYEDDIDPKDFGIKMLETYQDLEEGNIKLH
jgi:hypothetical protein